MDKNKKNYNVCLLGASLDVSNQGCRALTVSLVKLIVDIRPDAQINLLYGNRTPTKKVLDISGKNFRFVVTSFEHGMTSFLYETIYCGRGQMGNFIKEHKIALRSGRTSCHSFTANCFRLMLHSAVYVIMHTLREKALTCTPFAKAQFDTIRLKLLKIGVEVRELKTKLHFILPASCPVKDIFAMMVRNTALIT